MHLLRLIQTKLCILQFIALTLSSLILHSQTPVLVADLAGISSSYPRAFTYMEKNKIVFIAGGNSQQKLFLTDGTPAGTSQLLGSSFYTSPDNLISFDGKVLFIADVTFKGIEPWITDGTNSGTKMIRDLNPNSNGDGSDPGQYFEYKGNIFFAATKDFNGRELFQTDGTSAGTKLFKDFWFQGSGSPDSLAIINDTMYFTARDSNGFELWKSDGTFAGTKMIKDINPSGDSKPKGFMLFQGKIYFTADDGQHGREIWLTNGSEKGTVMLSDLQPGAASSNPAELTAFGTRLLFRAYSPTSGLELYSSDGTAKNTSLLYDINPGASDGFPHSLIPLGLKLVFRADDGIHGAELWSLDSSSSKPTLILDLNKGPSSSNPYHYEIVANEVYFSATNDTLGRELWKTNGFAISLVADLIPGSASGNPKYMALCGDDLYFQANGKFPVNITNVEAYKIDGVCSSFNAVISEINGELLTLKGGQNYQWFDCSNGTNKIEGATSSNYRPTTNGQYSVYVEYNGCKDTSSCFQSNYIGLEEVKNDNSLKVIPNPSLGAFHLDFTSNSECHIEIRNLSGQIIYSEEMVDYHGENITLPKTTEKGIYFIFIRTESGLNTAKLIIE